MTCKEARPWIHRSQDGALPPDRRKDLDAHLGACPGCRSFGRESGWSRGLLKQDGVPEPLPYFYERLQAKISEREKAGPWTLWLRWSVRAIPVSLVLIALFIGAIAFIGPAVEDDLSQPEALLLRDANPLSETNALFDDARIEDKSMKIIFAGNELIPARRYLP